MKILVLSDSHASLHYMRQAIAAVRPDAVVHLGDYYDDGGAMAEENPHIVFHRVPGNCDSYRCDGSIPRILCYEVGGVRLYMTHGHQHGVKFTTGRLIADARRMGAQAALYGHTHEADCHQESDGMWVLNPGTCGSGGGSVALMVTEQGSIRSCQILELRDLV